MSIFEQLRRLTWAHPPARLLQAWHDEGGGNDEPAKTVQKLHIPETGESNAEEEQTQ
jgi:hypothetical protein